MSSAYAMLMNYQSSIVRHCGATRTRCSSCLGLVLHLAALGVACTGCALFCAARRRQMRLLVCNVVLAQLGRYTMEDATPTTSVA